jgi:hypothetical protein
MSADESYDAVQAAPAEPDLAFDLTGDDFDLPSPPNRDEFDPPITDEGEDRAA